MSKRRRSPVVDYLVYLAVRLVIAFVELLSYEAGCSLADTLAWLVYHLDRRHRNVAIDNIRHAYPHASERGIDRLVRRTYRHFCRLLIDIVHTRRKLSPTTWRRYVVFDEASLAHYAWDGRAYLVVGGHFGNWEIGNYMSGMLGYITYAIARPLDNPYLEKFLRRFRQKTGQQLLTKKGELDKMHQVLQDGHILGAMIDQDAGPRGVFVEFFGRPASTHKSIALLALQHRVPIGVLGLYKIGPGMRYQGIYGDLIYPEEYAGHPDAVQAITQRFTTALEQIVRLAPEQYFWLHRRWKHKPPEKKHAQAA
jgi:KDO2-lipid IV(A) lauroyltransferase